MRWRSFIDLLTDADLHKQAKADFDKRTEGFTYKSPIPDIIKELSGRPDGEFVIFRKADEPETGSDVGKKSDEIAGGQPQKMGSEEKKAKSKSGDQ